METAFSRYLETEVALAQAVVKKLDELGSEVARLAVLAVVGRARIEELERKVAAAEARYGVTL